MKMQMQTEKYTDAIQKWPGQGRHIMAHLAGNDMVVYQAYKPSIAAAAVSDQALGGGGFSYERMSWIKPNFLWMMYRCGWAGKEGQERVLALWLRIDDFKKIVAESVPSTCDLNIYDSNKAWQEDLRVKDVRLQWDPDHDPYGRKLERRAIQLGLRGKTLAAFGKIYVHRIEDITPFVQEQKQMLDKQGTEALIVPTEQALHIEEPGLRKILSLQHI